MGDDFDLFPKRESLDPFSFDSKEKEKDQQAREQEPKEDERPDHDILFGQEFLQPPEPGEEPVRTPLDQSSPPETVPPDEGLSSEDVPADDILLDELPGTEEPLRGALEPPISGPIPDDQSGYGVPGQGEVDQKAAGGRRPSPFVTVGGAILLILLILYGVLTYLQKGSRSSAPSQSPGSVTMKVPERPAETPANKPTAAKSVEGRAAPAVQNQASKPPEITAPEEKPRGSEIPPQEEPVKPTPKPAPTGQAVTKAEPAPERPQEATAKVQAPAVSKQQPLASFTVQVGALLLKSSVKELENKLAGLGYEPFFREGSTNAMMHYLSVGPFAQRSEAQDALARIRKAGYEGNLANRSGGGAVIFAGSFLLEKNARTVMDGIRRLGYPVRLTKKETRMPMTFVRVGKFSTKDRAVEMRAELQRKGFDAIVVKLR